MVTLLATVLVGAAQLGAPVPVGGPAAQAEQIILGDQTALVPALIDELPASYTGYGGVSVLGDGRLVIGFNGTPPAERIDPDGPPFWTCEFRVFNLGTDPLLLVNSGNTWALERDDASAASAALLARAERVVPVASPAEYTCSSQSLLDVVGWIWIQFEPEFEGYVVEVLSDATEPERFLAALTLHSPSADAGPLGNLQANQTTCKADCSGGECSITCRGTGPGKGASCWCDKNGQPHCQCGVPTKDAQVYHLELLNGYEFP